jgi:Tol biopolymer transport system component
VFEVAVRLASAGIGSIFTPRIGASLIAALALLAGLGCAGNDDVEPAGRIVAWVEDEAFLIRPGEGTLERLSIGDYEFWDAAFSADGRRVAFNPRYGIEAAGITLMTLGDERASLVPNQPAQDEYSSWGIAWAPDGERLAFVNGDRVFTIATDGSEIRKLGSGVHPVWTPDGDHIVYTSGRYTGRDQDIVVVRADGTGRRLLGRGLYPDVSPSGDEVAYSTPIGVFVLPFAGDGEPRLVVSNGFGPVWSPDGEFLAFTRHTDCGHAVCRGRVFVVSADGGEPRAVGPVTGDPVEPQDWIR